MKRNSERENKEISQSLHVRKIFFVCVCVFFLINKGLGIDENQGVSKKQEQIQRVTKNLLIAF